MHGRVPRPQTQQPYHQKITAKPCIFYQSIKHFTAAFLFATGGYAAQAQTTDAGIMPFLGLETNARTAGMAGAATAVTDNPLAVYANAALSLIGERHAGGTLFSGTLEYGFRQRQCALRRGGILYSRLAELPVGRSALFPRTFGRVDRRTGISRRNGPSARPFGGGRLRPSDRPESGVFADGRYVRSDQGFGEKPMQGVSFDIGAAYRGTLRAVEGAAGSSGCGWPTSAPM